MCHAVFTACYDYRKKGRSVRTVVKTVKRELSNFMFAVLNPYNPERHTSEPLQRRTMRTLPAAD